ncbi:MAG: hypothetical protein D6732_02925 [Methanobacteriota archaeon]|nr:MAG: hypothetical protein D6732_02925 [Euryarchaeota archaeon]
MNFDELYIVKEKLENDPDPETAWKYFLNTLGTDKKFMTRGQRIEHEKLEAVIIRITERVYKTKVKTSQFSFREIPEYHFIHGVGALDRFQVSALYFRDINKGALTLIDPLNMPRIEFVRFTEVDISPPPGTIPTPMPPERQ